MTQMPNFAVVNPQISAVKSLHLFIKPVFFFFFNVSHFKSLYWICYNIVSVVCSGLLATRHMGSWLPD